MTPRSWRWQEAFDSMDLNTRTNRHGHLALQAATAGHFEIVKILCEHGAIVDASINGVSVMHAVATNGSAAILEYLTEERQTCTSHSTGDGLRVLDVAISNPKATVKDDLERLLEGRSSALKRAAALERSLDTVCQWWHRVRERPSGKLQRPLSSCTARESRDRQASRRPRRRCDRFVRQYARGSVRRPVHAANSHRAHWGSKHCQVPVRECRRRGACDQPA